MPIPEDASTTPQVEIDGVGIGTVNVSNHIGSEVPFHPKTSATIDSSDSALLIGASQRLYDNSSVGSAVLGGVTTEGDGKSGSSQIFLQQAFVDLQSAGTEVLIGRSDNVTAHRVDFPTLRSDDLLKYTSPSNPFSNGLVSEEHRYADVASLTFNQNLSIFENLHAQHLIDSRPDFAGKSAEGINSYGVSFEYLSPPGLEAMHRVVSAELGYEHLKLEQSAPHGLDTFYTGGVLNIKKSAVHRIELRLQDIVTTGSSLKAFNTITDTYQADNNAVAASLRYLNSPFGMPGYQLSLTGGYRSFTKVSTASSWGAAVTGVRRFGQGFDLVAEYLIESSKPKLAAVDGGRSYLYSVQAGFVFNFSATFNQHIAPRRSLLNLEHQYVPQ